MTTFLIAIKIPGHEFKNNKSSVSLCLCGNYRLDPLLWLFLIAGIDPLSKMPFTAQGFSGSGLNKKYNEMSS
jgi:hypothetical protein